MPPENRTPIDPKDHLLQAHNPRQDGSGPVVGTIIILILLVLGGIYFWTESQKKAAPAPLPFIPGDTSEQP